MNSENLGCGLLALFVLAPILLLIIWLGPVRAHDQAQVQIEVKNKERTLKSDESYWQVFGTNEVFAVKDSIWLLRFDASDRYNKLDPGKTYDCEVSGWRVQFMSWYRNILDCTEVPNAK